MMAVTKLDARIVLTTKGKWMIQIDPPPDADSDDASNFMLLLANQRLHTRVAGASIIVEVNNG